MAPAHRAVLAAALTLIIGSSLELIALKRRWIVRFNWVAALVAPVGVGLLTYWTI